MKNKASGIVKEVITVLASMAKSKTLAIKRKTDALRTRIIIYSLLSNRKFLMTSMSQKLNSILGQDEKKFFKEDGNVSTDHQDGQTNDKGIVLHNNAMSYEPLPNPTQTETFEDAKDKECVDDMKYLDMTDCLVDEDTEDDFQDPGGSVIDIVKNSKQDGEDFRLEDEIDRAADLFIKRFHRQMRIQKQESFKRCQDMLDRSA